MSTITLIDVTRLLARGHHPAPRGIDRVDLEYALEFGARGTSRFCFNDEHGWRLFQHAAMRCVSAALATRWFGKPEDSAARAGQRLLRALRTRRERSLALRLLTRPLDPTALPKGPVVYVNVSHKGWNRLAALSRLFRNRRLAIVVMVHDLMPILSGRFFPQALCESFVSGFAAVVRHADLVLTNSAQTAMQIGQYCERTDLRLPRTVTIPLGVRTPERVHSDAVKKTNFLVVGAIEDRKNIGLLLDVWDRLQSTRAAVPTLYLIGEAQRALDPRIYHAGPMIQLRSGLDDQCVAGYWSSTRALLFPSRVEGFGLPVLEALACGTPVIASDVQVLREHSQDVPEFLPNEPAAWESAVQDYASESSERRAGQIRKMARFRAPTWDAHFAKLRQVIRDDLIPAAIGLDEPQ